MGMAERLLASLTGDAGVRQSLVRAFWTAAVLDTHPPQCCLASMPRAKGGGLWPPVVEASLLLGLGTRPRPRRFACEPRQRDTAPGRRGGSERHVAATPLTIL
jgi:hypothetical protein